MKNVPGIHFQNEFNDKKNVYWMNAITIDAQVYGKNRDQLMQYLKENNVDSKVVSMPCMELFDQQSEDYKKDILEEDSLLITLVAIDLVPFAKFSFSKYPAGPFHKTVLDCSIFFLILLTVIDPISKIISLS